MSGAGGDQLTAAGFPGPPAFTARELFTRIRLKVGWVVNVKSGTSCARSILVFAEVSGVSEPKTRLAVVLFRERCGSLSLLKAGQQECL